VSTDSIKFNFACFQLNTLDFSTTTGVKNLVWFDSQGNHAMYNKILPKRAMLRNTKYEDYDPEVLQKILAFYVSGANIDSTVKRNQSMA
jgi:large subunit ribosomal protein L37